MKKKAVLKMITKIGALCLTGLLFAGSLAGCAGSSTNPGESGQESSQVQAAEGQSNAGDGQVEDTKRVLLQDVDCKQYVAVGDYQALRVSKEEVEVTDEELKSAMNEEYRKRFPAEKGVMDKAVAVGDTANIDFEGKKDGVAFEGGTAKGYLLTIGSNRFISGFEDGLVGVMPGETIDLNLRFPDNYKDTELAGQEVVFTVKVNYVIPEEIDEAVIADFGIESVSNLEEFRNYVHDVLYSQKLSRNEQAYENEIFNEFMNLCEFKELPQELIDSSKHVIKTSLTATASQYGLDAETYVYYTYRTDLATFLDYFAESSQRQNMALYQVAINEKLIPDDEELKKVILDYAQQMGYEDVDAYLEAIGATMDEFREDYSIAQAYDKIIEIAQQ